MYLSSFHLGWNVPRVIYILTKSDGPLHTAVLRAAMIIIIRQDKSHKERLCDDPENSNFAFLHDESDPLA